VGVAFTALQSLISYLYGEDVIIEDEDEEQKFLEAAKALEIIGLVNQVVSFIFRIMYCAKANC